MDPPTQVAHGVSQWHWKEMWKGIFQEDGNSDPHKGMKSSESGKYGGKYFFNYFLISLRDDWAFRARLMSAGRELGFPCGSAGKESTCNAGDLGLIPGLVRSPWEGKATPLQYSGLENSKDCIVHGVTKSQTRLSDFHFHLMSTNCGVSNTDRSKMYDNNNKKDKKEVNEADCCK